MAKYIITPGRSKTGYDKVQDIMPATIEEALLKLGDKLVIDLRQNLIDEYKKVYPGRTTSLNLAQSITPSDVTVTVNESVAMLEFRMEQYGLFLDQGVRGRTGTRASNSPFKFKKKNLPESIRKGIVANGGFKGIKNDKEAKSLGFLIGRSITKKGLLPVPFFSDYVNNEWKEEVKKEISNILGQKITGFVIGFDLR